MPIDFIGGSLDVAIHGGFIVIEVTYDFGLGIEGGYSFDILLNYQDAMTLCSKLQSLSADGCSIEGVNIYPDDDFIWIESLEPGVNVFCNENLMLGDMSSLVELSSMINEHLT